MRQKGNGVRTSRLWAQMLGCENTVIEGVDWDQRDDAGGGQLSITVHVRPVRRLAGRCPACGKKRPGYDQGDGRRRWRALDLGTVRAELEAAAPRVGVRGVRIVGLSYHRGQKYVFVIVNRAAGRLIWAAPGREGSTVHA